MEPSGRPAVACVGWLQTVFPCHTQGEISSQNALSVGCFILPPKVWASSGWHGGWPRAFSLELSGLEAQTPAFASVRSPPMRNSSCRRPASAEASSPEGELIVPVVALTKRSPAGAEPWGDQGRSVGLPGQGHPPPSQSTSLHTTFRIATPGAFVQRVCPAPWAVWLILHHSCSVCFCGGARPWDGGGRAQRASVAREWSRFLAWPVWEQSHLLSVCAFTSIQRGWLLAELPPPT